MDILLLEHILILNLHKIDVISQTRLLIKNVRLDKDLNCFIFSNGKIAEQ